MTVEQAYAKPDFQFLIWDSLKNKGYRTAYTLREAMVNINYMLNYLNMDMVTVFEWVETDIGYITVEAMKVCKIDERAVTIMGSMMNGLHVGWYLQNYEVLK